MNELILDSISGVVKKTLGSEYLSFIFLEKSINSSNSFFVSIERRLYMLLFFKNSS